MNKFKNYISIAFLALAVGGILISMAHYHSSGLECLDHANEQHYTENELVCPVCTIVTYSNSPNTNFLSDVQEFEESILDVSSLYLSAQPFVPLLGRAPPFLI